MKIYHYTDLNGLKGIIESGSLNRVIQQSPGDSLAFGAY